jgi:hypothetical protein
MRGLDRSITAQLIIGFLLLLGAQLRGALNVTLTMCPSQNHIDYAAALQTTAAVYGSVYRPDTKSGFCYSKSPIGWFSETLTVWVSEQVGIGMLLPQSPYVSSNILFVVLFPALWDMAI